MKMKEIKAPNIVPLSGANLFLAGSIEMGTAEKWQDRVCKFFEYSEITILNPRRDDWDSSWEQKESNDQFREQVMWEIKGQEVADYILMYFDPNTKAPITLLELGLFAESEKLIVVCPDGFWRKGNVEVVCKYHEIPLYNDLDKALQVLIKKL